MESVRLYTALGIVGSTALSSGGGVFYAASHIHGVLSLLVFGLVPVAAAVGVGVSATVFHRWL
jgi:hypothetical protein